MKRRTVLQKIAGSLAFNGCYVFAIDLFLRLGSKLRSRMYSVVFGVRVAAIGPRPHIRGAKFISMGPGFRAGEGLWLEALARHGDQEFTPRIMMGENVGVSNWTHIAATNYVEIGANVLMGSKVIVIDHNHGQYSGDHTSPHIPPAERPLDCDRRVVIGKNVWLGDGVVVTPGSTIGEGSIIGANSVVMGRIPPFAIAAGAPARVLKTFDFNNEKWTKVE